MVALQPDAAPLVTQPAIKAKDKVGFLLLNSFISEEMAPTQLDRMLHSRNAFLAFSGIITAVAAWTILKPDPIFPQTDSPHGDPNEWTLSELKKWLRKRGLDFSEAATRAELVEMVKLNIRRPGQ